jgi:hypothetical protein
MTVVAFPPRRPPSARAQAKLAGLCDGDGKTACAEVGIYSLDAAGASDYAEVVTAYGR